MQAQTLLKAQMSFKELRVAGNADLLLDIQDLHIARGCQVAIIGGNGAGKTTFIEAILGLRKTTRSGVEWIGDREKLGVQLQNAGYNHEMLVKDIVALHRKLYRKSDAKLYQTLDIEPLTVKKYGVLSRGEKQRVDLYVAMAHTPETLIMDEPGTGLDKAYYRAFYDKVSELNQQGNCTILMASHTAVELCLADHILWIEGGKLKRFTQKTVLLNELLGPVRVKLKLNNLAETGELNQLLQQQRFFRSSKFLPNDDILVFGEAELRDWVLERAKTTSLSKLSISDTDEEDLLHYIVASRETQTNRG